MKNRYEALLALDLQGKEEAAKDIIERLEKEFAAEGAEVEQTQRLERRELAYEHNHSKSAYFVNLVFSADSSLIEKLRTKLKTDEDISLQQIMRLADKKESAPAGA